MGFPVLPTAALVNRLTVMNYNLYNGVDSEALLRLFKNDVSPDPNMTIATFEEADVAGYAAANVAFGAVSLNDQGLVVTRSAPLNCFVAAGVDPQTIYGVYLTNSDNTLVLAAQRFEEPQTVGGPLPTAISGIFRMSEPLSSYGWVDVEA